jgi:LysM repeat protein
MNFVAITAGAILLAAITNLPAQSLAPTPANMSSEAMQLQMLSKKIDEQNAKIDMLSQQILKLQLELANQRPGVMIGETTPTTSASPPAAAQSSSPPKNGNGNTHTVARGETLTSIAKMHGVSVGDLQKYNHIDNPLKLQAGQTLLIPTPTPPATPSPGE